MPHKIALTVTGEGVGALRRRADRGEQAAWRPVGTLCTSPATVPLRRAAKMAERLRLKAIKRPPRPPAAPAAGPETAEPVAEGGDA